MEEVNNKSLDKQNDMDIKYALVQLPAYFVHTNNETGVPVENTLLMYKALRANKIPAELHILSEGEHGFGLGTGNEHINSWTNSLKLRFNWLNKK
jgi:dipeptidyl aminopeptidase/acylaminoacyl peptidase